MPARRRKITRMPHVRISREVAFAFAQVQKLEQQCSCAGPHDECRACKEWWHQQSPIRTALKIKPHIWPVLPEPGPGRDSGPFAHSLYAELNNALSPDG
jgi:hypothetical protein